jgi:microcystin-dependent protein
MGGNEPYLGMLMAVAFNFAPRGWAICDGSVLNISQNDALFTLLGTTFGGDGINTFGLPDLRGRSAIGTGQGPGLSSYLTGESSGVENVTVTIPQMTAHSHVSTCASQTQNSAVPNNSVLASGPAIYASPSTGTSLAPATITISGGSQPHNNMQPCLALNWVISLEGIFPSQN